MLPEGGIVGERVPPNPDHGPPARETALQTPDPSSLPVCEPVTGGAVEQGAVSRRVLGLSHAALSSS